MGKWAMLGSMLLAATTMSGAIRAAEPVKGSSSPLEKLKLGPIADIKQIFGPSGELEGIRLGTPQPRDEDGHHHFFVALSPDDTLLVYNSCLLDLRGAEPKEHSFGDSMLMKPSRFSPDGRVLAVPGLAQAVLWDVSGAAPRQTAVISKPMWRVAFSPDGKTLAGLHMTDAMSLCLWDLSGSKPRERAAIARVPVEDNLMVRPWDIAISPDGRTLAACFWGHALRLWDISEGSFKDKATLKGQGRVPLYVQFSPDSKRLATAYQYEAGVRWWNLAEAALDERASFEKPTRPWQDSRRALALSHDGEQVALSNGTHVVIWSAKTGKKLRELELEGARDVGFSSDGRYLLVTSNNSTLFILRLTPPPR
jgi:WD40 repeat protein